MRQGRFDQPASETAQLYSESVSVDWRLYSHDNRGSLVARAATAKLALSNLSLFEMQEVSRLFEQDVVKVFDVRGSLAKRTAMGAPSPENVSAQIARWRSLL